MLATGAQIYLVTGHATAPCAVAVSGVHCLVVNATEKGVQLAPLDRHGGINQGAAVWFPRKAIVVTPPLSNDPGRTDSHRLAHWFRPDGYASRWLERFATHATLAA